MKKKEQIKELQQIADKHISLKKEIEGLLDQGDKIENKYKNFERILNIKENVESMTKELDSIEEEYYETL